MKKVKNFLLPLSVFVITSCCIMLVSQFKIGTQEAVAQTSAVSGSSTSSSTVKYRLSGYAWSENIGWISFVDGAKPVMVDKNGNLSGYAWSENIGWIQFGGLSGFPNTTVGSNAKIGVDSMTGWARVVSGNAPSKGNPDNRAGFDGWISLDGSGYGVRVIENMTLAGFAWGSTVVGWIDMSGVKITQLLNSCRGPYGTTIPDGQNFTFYTNIDSNGFCGSEVRTCTDGVLSGSLTEIGCEIDIPSPCERAGKTFNHGEKITLYTKSISPKNQTCEDFKKELTCDDGNFLDIEGNIDTTTNIPKCIQNPDFTEI